MKRNLSVGSEVSASVWFLVLTLLFSLCSSQAAESTWTGGGANNFWTTAANWDALPSAGDSLRFTGQTRLVNSNTFAAATTFSGFTFQTPVGAFALHGNSVTLSGNITNNQELTLQSINLPLILSATPTVNVGTGGRLLLGGVVSGGFGLTKVGPGTLFLTVSNTFTGPVSVNEGTVNISVDRNLGAVPGAPTAARVVLNGGTLAAASSLTLSPNRGIAVGPTAGSGSGVISVPVNSSLIYSGIIANNGAGTGGLDKNSFGEVRLSGANTYTGPTRVLNGTLVLDFSAAGAPASHIIRTNSSLQLGGALAAGGNTNFAMLSIVPKANSTISQGFNGANVTFGASVIRVDTNANTVANLSLGQLTHEPGGTITIATPNSIGGGTNFGSVSTTATNINGILGVWATVSDGILTTNTQTANRLFPVLLGTNLATVLPDGKIDIYTNYAVYPGIGTWPTLNPFVGAATNLLLDASVPTGNVRIDNDLAGTTTELNAMIFRRNNNSNFNIFLGTNNTLRMGRVGGFFKSDTFAGVTIQLLAGLHPVNTNTPVQGNATLTAGGAPNTPGELIVNMNSTRQDQGSLNIEVTITDNGTGPVTFVKTGPGSMKLRGHNTHSGGNYLLQGRVQFAGQELSLAGGTGNPDGGGTGPIYVLPGAYLFPSGIGTAAAITNDLFVAGSGMAGEPLGCLRNGIYSGTITLIGDANLGSSTLSTAIGGGPEIRGKITGPFNVDLLSLVTVSGSWLLSSPSNDWSGQTVIHASSRATPPRPNKLMNGTNDVIPNGFGKGNVIMSGNSSNTVGWDLNGFNETVNGLSTSNTAFLCFISNYVANTVSTFTVGDNDQSSTFGGTFADGGAGVNPAFGTLNLRKIGSGTFTLTGSNIYSGNTLVENGTLAVTGQASLTNSALTLVSPGARYDISGLPGFSTTKIITLAGGALVASTNNTGGSGIGTLNSTNGQITMPINPNTTNVVASTFTTGGDSNVLNIISVQGVTSYPATFTIVKFTTFQGVTNWVLGSLPSTTTGGYFTNDASRLLLVLTNGPKSLLWTGTNATNPTWWDVATTINWLGFGVPEVFNTGDAVTFDDTGATNIVDVRVPVVPVQITVNNSTKDYTFIGSGNIGGFGPLVKSGTGTLTLLTSDAFAGGVSVNDGRVILARDNAILGGVSVAAAGTVQVGTNGGTGTLPGGTVQNNGVLIFNRGADYSVDNFITGAVTGTIIKTNSGLLALTGANTYNGPVSVVDGALQVGHNSALGTITNGTTIGSGATLDVNGFNVGYEPITISGTGLGGNGALVNNAASSTGTVRTVTLAADSTVGGTAEWEIRTLVQQATLGGAFTLTKIGASRVTLAGVDASTLGNIIVQNGALRLEGGVVFGAGLITISNIASVEYYSNTVIIPRSFDIYGNGSTPNVMIVGGTPIVSGTNGLTGTVVVSGDGESLRLSGSSSGSGSVVKQGSSRLAFTGAASYTGTTLVSAGTVIFDGGKTGGSGITVALGGALGGGGPTISGENVTVNGGLAPGNPDNVGQQILTFGNNVTLNSSTNLFELSPSTVAGNDQLSVFGDLTLTGTNIFRISVTDYLTVGDVYTLVTYFGTGNNITTNSVQIVPPTFGYQFALIDPATTPGEIRIQVLVAIGFSSWKGSHPINPSFWDNGVTANWLKGGVTGVFTNGDFALFSDFTPGFVGSSTNINVIGALNTSGIIFSNTTAAPFRFIGSGTLSGGGLVLEGEGRVTIANTGTNTMTGGGLIDWNTAVFFNAATLHIGEGGTGGSLGTGALTNNGTLVFNRAGSLNVSNSIQGDGFMTNVGPGTVTFHMPSTYTAQFDVRAGTVAAGNNLAFGVTNGGLKVFEGATLDVNGFSLAGERVIVGGTGVGDAGAIVNNNPLFQSGNAVQHVTLTTNTSFGGVSRWNLQSSAIAALATDPPGSAYNIRKVGVNTVAIIGITNIEPALADIDIAEGVLLLEGGLGQLGNPTNTITVYTNSTLHFRDLTRGPLNKRVVMQHGAVLWSELQSSTNIGPIVLQGSNTFDVGSVKFRHSDNSITGSGSLWKIGGANLELAGTNLWTGETVVINGRISLMGNTSLTNSSVITLMNTNATINVADRVDSTLTIRSGQTLRGNGDIDGNLVLNSGATLTVGLTSMLGEIEVTNAATLNGTINMELDAAALTNDVLFVVTNTLTYGGTLNVANINGTLAAGQSFRLFRAATYAGSFTTVNLPALTSGLYWTNTLNVNGTIAVAGGISVQPTITSIGIDGGGNLVIRGTNNVGSGGPTTVYILTSTNLLMPLSNWTVFATNAFDGAGLLNYTNGVPGDPSRFYMLQLP